MIKVMKFIYYRQNKMFKSYKETWYNVTKGGSICP